MASSSRSAGTPPPPTGMVHSSVFFSSLLLQRCLRHKPATYNSTRQVAAYPEGDLTCETSPFIVVKHCTSTRLVELPCLQPNHHKVQKRQDSHDLLLYRPLLKPMPCSAVLHRYHVITPDMSHIVRCESNKKQHLRMSGVYWGLMGMALMGRDLRKEMGAEDLASWVMRCQHEGGG